MLRFCSLAPMELRHLRYFVSVAELGSVSRASEKLFVAQPALSAQIRQLEEEVGVPLFVRLPRGVRLTAAGESFLEDARIILSRTLQAARRARSREQDQQQVFRIGLVPSATHGWLPAVLNRLREEGHGLRVEVRELITSRQLQALRDNEIEIGLGRPGPGLDERFVLAVIDDPYCLALPQGHPLAQPGLPLDLAEAASEHFVGFSRYQVADFFDRTAALCLAAGFSPDVRHEAGQFLNVLALVACGLGVAIVPASFAVLGAEGVVFRRLEPLGLPSQLALLGRGWQEQQQLTSEPVRTTLATALTRIGQAELASLARRIQAL